MTDKSRVIALIAAAAGLLLIVGSMTVFSACRPKDDGTWMNCHNAQIDVALAGAGLTALFVIAAFVRNRSVRVICFAAALVLSAVAFLIPGTLVHMCFLDHMRCQAVLKPFTKGMTGITALLALWGIFNTVSKKQEDEQETD